MNLKKLTYAITSSLVVILLNSASTYAAMTDHTSIPVTIIDGADPNVLINLSIETPMQGAAYNDQDDTASGGSCTGRIGTNVGICYLPTKEYIGYFDPNKCYDYSAGNARFEPNGATTATHTCTGQWSGNVLNWATMTATDEFRWALNGGTRITDTATETVLERSVMGLPASHSWFPSKKLDLTNNVAPSSVTPYADATIYFTSSGVQLDVGTTQDGNEKADNLNVHVKVCDASEGLETNCKPYGTIYKPEGLIQKNSSFMRFAVMSYLRDADKNRDGGVLRTNMKYVGPSMPNPLGGIMANPNKEWDATTGIQLGITDPDGLAALDADITYSGAINYINGFGRNGYKSYDPIGELFYECINYFKKRGPTAEYSTGLTAAMKDDFPVINGTGYPSTAITGNNAWIDPIQHQCQNNYIVGINDANPWLDKKLPGNTWSSGDLTSKTGSTQGNDYGEPSNPDSYDVTAWTNTVGDLQNITGTSRCVGGDVSTWDGAATNKTITALGEVMGSCSYVPKENSYGIAGLAYYANTQDIRSDIAEKQTISTFLIDTQEYNADPLTGEMNMLWLAGKYGGFTENPSDLTDTNSDGNLYEPNQVGEWDADGDGEPDNYVLATDPAKLVTGLNRAFSSIERRQSAGAAAAVISNTTSSTSNIIQALYQPRKFSNTSEVQWVGKLHSIWVDDDNNLREDLGPGGIPNGKLDSTFAVDPKIHLIYNPAVERTQIYYCTGSPCTAKSEFSTKEVDELNPVWDAEKVLSQLSNSTIDTQRTYSSKVDPASNTNGRYIFTWMDNGAGTNTDNGNVDSDEFMNFTDSAIDSSNYGYLNLLVDTNGVSGINATDADNIVNFIRGQEGVETSFRSRTLDSRAYRLGDIIHSSPLALESPNAQWDDKFADPTYTTFRLQYAKRRQVVYVGANDGMLHAFNAGFFDPVNKQYNLKNTTETEHVLGAELWAYVPKNVLPHLQWLAHPNYPHTYYVDGSMQTFDVNIFPKTGDTVHPGGWGTILVATMRFGGNPITYDHDYDGATAEITTRSAVIIMDVTDPELAPKLLAEFTHSDLGFTTSTPDLIVKRTPDDFGDWNNAGTSTFPNDWYLVFGSGPNQFAGSTVGNEGISTQPATAYILKLLLSGTAPNQYLDTSANLNTISSPDANTFIGDPLVVDWSNDFQSDAVYFGTVNNTVTEPGGELLRWNIGGLDPTAWTSLLSPQISSLVVPSVTAGVIGQPFITKPHAVKDTTGSGTPWVFAGTGRLYVKDDNLSQTQHSYYGIKERLDVNNLPIAYTANRSGGIDADLLQDVTDVLLDSGGAVTNIANLPAGTATFNDIKALTSGATRAGWFLDFENRPGDPANERTLSGSAFLSDLIYFTTYRPPTDVCTAVGQGRLFGLYYKTGTMHPEAGLRVKSDVFTDAAGDFTPYVELGDVQGFTPIIVKDEMLITKDDGSFESPDTTSPPITSGRQSWREIILEY